MGTSDLERHLSRRDLLNHRAGFDCDLIGRTGRSDSCIQGQSVQRSTAPSLPVSHAASTGIALIAVAGSLAMVSI